MNSATLRAQIRAVVFGIFGIALAIVLVRIILRLVGANPDSQFVIFWYDLSNLFVGLFRDMYPTLQQALLRINIELFSVLALVFYLLMAVLVQKSLASFTEDTTVDVIKSIVDSLFKFLEFLLIGRFLLKLTGASVVSDFTRFIYGLSAVVYEPFKDILPAITINEFNIIFESSTLIAIVVVIIFDLVTEGIIDSIMGIPRSPKRQRMAAPVAAPVYVQQQPAQPNVTINIPPQPQVVDHRQVHIVNPPQYTGPGYGANQLNTQRPQQLPQHPQQYYPQPQASGVSAPRNPYGGGGYPA